MATFKPIVFSAKEHLKNDGTKNIKIRIYHNKQSQYLPTPYYIEPGFLGLDGNISSFYPDSDMLNYELGEIMQLHKKNFLQLGVSRTSKMSCSELKEILQSMSEQKSDYIDFVDFANTLIDNTTKEKTASWYRCSLESFKKFWKANRINACDITANRMREYKDYLEKNGMQPGGINNYMRGIRSLFNKCKNHHNREDYDIILIPNKPFKNVDIPEYRRQRKNIPIEMVKQIRDGIFETERENFAKDMFMMMFYLMGINVNDLFNLRTPVGGRIEYERSKTNTKDNIYKFPLSIRIEPELKILIDKYSTNVFLSDIKMKYSCSYNFMKAINIGLKRICEELNIPKITTNWARHSWASIARNKAKVPKADVDFCLGHVNNDYKMADIYIDIDYGISDDANRKVLDLLK
ncbi:MAG: phage integrase SAM-like domain-containing protein [Petrimonas sp.]|uniref:tyrosine-type recombinase/integrase n=1 Tax=Petrimonas sp. TaxID=2023866 RepID=UPI002B393D1B|nr:phage integrase SAM-like domain-containing protein [Petrimonas sp.]MEA4980756.1 phage integrase SAM-like domain-containing protein [Petrimonas sp.]MEA5046736.1 phage integrase SAM-like domain-containing protein [Petrimonas sp.]